MKKKTIFSWIKEFLSIHGKGFDGTPPAPSVETVEKLIRRAVNEKQREENGKDQENDPDVRESAENVEETPEADSRKESCPYALKRNIVSSIEEVKRFAEEHELAATVVKALLALLAELASNTLKGKVSGTLLLTLLNALNFDKAREAAYREGEVAGRNAKIEEEYFPTLDDGVPHFNGAVNRGAGKDDIFSMAAKCR